MSTSQRRDIIWNMTDPGDPYDIKKSLIAKLPGDNKIFMGDHLELVALFQAAEIQRLIESLNDYKLKYKELEKIQLDRHSYEVQIKQLTEWCQNLQPLKSENIRLKQFAVRQTTEIEELQRQLQGVDEDLNYKYEQALQKIDSLYSENKNLQGQLNRTKTQIIALQRSKHRELDELKFLQNEKNLNQQRQIADIKTRLTSQIMQLQGEVRRYQEKLQNERLTTQDLRFREKSISSQLDQAKNRLSASTTLQNKMGEYNRKLQVLVIQKDRIQQILNQKNRQNLRLKSQIQTKQQLLGRFQQQIKDCERRISQLQNENYSLRLNMPTGVSPIKVVVTEDGTDGQDLSRSQFNELLRRIKQYEEKFGLVTQENQRLTQIINTKNRKIQQIQRESKIMQDELFQSRNIISPGNYTPSPKKPDYSSQIKKSDEIRQLKIKNSSLLREIQSLKGQNSSSIERLQIEIQSWKLQVERLRSQKLSLSGSSRQKPGDNKLLIPRPVVPLPIDSRPSAINREQISSLNNQVLELKKVINWRQQQINDYKQRIVELREANSQINTARDFPQEFLTPVKFDEIRQRLNETENKNISLNKQIQRLHNIIHVKDSQYQIINEEVNRLRNQAYQIPQAQNLASSKIDRVLKQENDELRRKLVPWSQEISRLNSVLGIKVNELIQLSHENKVIRQDIIVLEGQLQQANSSLRQNQRQISDLKNKIKNQVNLVNTTPNIPSNIGGSSVRVSTTQNDPRIQRLISENRRLEEQIIKKNIQIQKLSSNQILLQSGAQASNQMQISSLKQQINRLTQTSRRSEAENSQIINQNRRLQNYINNFKNDTTSDAQKIFEYQSTISELKTRNDQLSRQMQTLVGSSNSQNGKFITEIKQYQERILMLSTELERLNLLGRQKQQEWNRSRIELQNHINRLISQQNQDNQTSDANFRNQLNESNRRISALADENNNLKRNINNLESQLNDRGNHINRLVQEIQKANMTINQHVEQIRNYQKTYGEFVPYKQQLQYKIKQQHLLIQNGQEQIPKLAAEIERLNVNLAEKIQESEQLKRNLNQYHGRYQELVSKYELVVNTANSHNEMREQQIQVKLREYQQHIAQLTNAYQENKRESHNIFQQFKQAQARVHGLSAEIERLNNVLQSRIQEYQILVGELNKIKGQHNQYKSEADKERIEHQSLREEYQKQVFHLSSELERLTQAYNQKFEEEKSSYINQIERLNNALRIKVQESQEWQNQYEHLNRAHQQLANSYNQLVPEYQTSRSRMSEFQQKFNKLAQEFQRLSTIINTLKQENYNLKVELGKSGNLEDMNRRLSAQIDRLNKAKEELQQDIAELRMRYADEAALQKRLNQQLSLFVVLFAQIQSLRKRVKDKQKQVEEVRRSSLAPFRVA